MSATERTISFVDLVGFAAATEAHGDNTSAELAARLTGLTTDALAPGDELVKTLGDAVMIASESPDDALILLERLYGAAAEERDFPLLRGGVHAGPVARRDGDYFGATVNVAARVADLADGGQLYVTAPVADAARNRGHTVVDHGDVTLRNLSQRQSVHEVRTGVIGAAASICPVCRMRVVPDTSVRSSHKDHDAMFCSADCAGLFADDPDLYTAVTAGPPH